MRTAMKRIIFSAIVTLAVLTANAQEILRTDTIEKAKNPWDYTIVRTISMDNGVKIHNDIIYKDKKIWGRTVTRWNTYEGKQMPAFNVTSETMKSLASSSLKGKTVVISFWISSCGPCMKELRRVGPEIIDKYPADKFVFLAIGANETAETAKKFHIRSGATFDLYFDKAGTVMPKFADNGCPKVFVIDSNGIVRYAESGYNPAKFDKLKAKIKEVFDNNK